MQVVQWVIGGFMLFVIGFPIIMKQYYTNKAKNRLLTRVVNAQEEEKSELLKVEGLTTVPNSKNRAYVVKGKKTSPTDKKEGAGSTFETWYPEGMPRFLQVRVRAASYSEGNPNAVNFYGSQDALNITDKEIATIKKEKFSEIAVEVSKDYKDLLKDIKGYIKPGLSRTVVYILLAIVVLGIIGSVYLAYQNSVAISDLGGMWGW